MEHLFRSSQTDTTSLLAPNAYVAQRCCTGLTVDANCFRCTEIFSAPPPNAASETKQVSSACLSQLFDHELTTHGSCQLSMHGKVPSRTKCWRGLICWGPMGKWQRWRSPSVPMYIQIIQLSRFKCISTTLPLELLEGNLGLQEQCLLLAETATFPFLSKSHSWLAEKA